MNPEKHDTFEIERKESAAITEVHENPEYQEYLDLKAAFQGKRLTRLTRKVDWHVIPQLISIYLLSYIDRTNVGNAKLFSALKDMGLSGTQWNAGLSVFFITYGLCGPASNMLLKKFGPKIVLPTLLLCVSLVIIGTGCASKYSHWIATRLLLGIFEAGVFPGCFYTLTTWYTPAQIHSRTSIFFCAAPMAGAFSGLLAFGIGHLDGTWGYHGWRFIYIIEGLVSLVVAIIGYIFLYDKPDKVKSWLTDEERRFLVLRNEYEYGKNTGGADDEFRWSAAKESLKSWHVYLLSFTYFCVSVATYGLSFTLPTIISNMGFTATNAQLLSMPPYIFAVCVVIVAGFAADRFAKRMWSTVIPSTMGFIGLLIAVLTTMHKRLIPLSYIGVCLATGGFNCLSPCVSVWISLNQAGQTKRAMSVAMTLLFAQFGGLVGSNIYFANEAPSYPTGFGCSLGFLGAGCIVLPIIYWFLLGRINAKRQAMSEEEIYSKYTLEELHEMGDLSPLYRYER